MATTDRHDLSTAIDKAIADLTTLRAVLAPSSIRSIELQASSALAYVTYCQRVNMIFGDLLVVALDCAASLGNQHVSPGMRKDVRTNDLLDDILTDCVGWAEGVINEMETA